jgi:hypothetical protein
MSTEKHWRIALGERALDVVIVGQLDDDLLDRFLDLFVDLRNHERQPIHRNEGDEVR